MSSSCPMAQQAPPRRQARRPGPVLERPARNLVQHRGHASRSCNQVVSRVTGRAQDRRQQQPGDAPSCAAVTGATTGRRSWRRWASRRRRQGGWSGVRGERWRLARGASTLAQCGCRMRRLGASRTADPRHRVTPTCARSTYSSDGPYSPSPQVNGTLTRKRFKDDERLPVSPWSGRALTSEADLGHSVAGHRRTVVEQRDLRQRQHVRAVQVVPAAGSRCHSKTARQAARTNAACDAESRRTSTVT